MHTIAACAQSVIRLGRTCTPSCNGATSYVRLAIGLFRRPNAAKKAAALHTASPHKVNVQAPCKDGLTPVIPRFPYGPDATQQ